MARTPKISTPLPPDPGKGLSPRPRAPMGGKPKVPSMQRQKEASRAPGMGMGKGKPMGKPMGAPIGGVRPRMPK